MSRSNTEEIIGILWGIFAVSLDNYGMNIIATFAWAMCGVSMFAAIWLATKSSLEIRRLLKEEADDKASS